MVIDFMNVGIGSLRTGVPSCSAPAFSCSKAIDPTGAHRQRSLVNQCPSDSVDARPVARSTRKDSAARTATTDLHHGLLQSLLKRVVSKSSIESGSARVYRRMQFAAPTGLSQEVRAAAPCCIVGNYSPALIKSSNGGEQQATELHRRRKRARALSVRIVARVAPAALAEMIGTFERSDSYRQLGRPVETRWT